MHLYVHSSTIHNSQDTLLLLLLLLLSRFSRVDSVRPHRGQPTRLPRPWDSPGKNTGVGCQFLLQGMKVKSESESLSRVRLLATPRTAAYQAPPSMGFSSQEYWNEVPLMLPDVSVNKGWYSHPQRCTLRGLRMRKNGIRR